MLKHETGWAFDGEDRKLISGPIQLENGDRAVFLDEIWPDEKTQGDCQVYLHVRDYPQATETTLGPYTAADRMGVMTTARQIRFELRMASNKTDARIGSWRAILKTRGRSRRKPSTTVAMRRSFAIRFCEGLVRHMTGAAMSSFQLESAWLLHHLKGRSLSLDMMRTAISRYRTMLACRALSWPMTTAAPN
jgi:hypothetical protein